MEIERLEVFDSGVVGDVHPHRLGGLADGKGQGARHVREVVEIVGGVVAPARVLRRRIVDRDLAESRRTQRHHHVHVPGVLVDDVVTHADQRIRHRRRRRLHRRLELRHRHPVHWHRGASDLHHFQLSIRREAGQRKIDTGRGLPGVEPERLCRQHDVILDHPGQGRHGRGRSRAQLELQVEQVVVCQGGPGHQVQQRCHGDPP